MIKEHTSFELFDKLLLEKVVLVPPMRVPGIMPNEACFLYAVRGRSRLISQTEEMTMDTREGVVMHCGNFLNEWLEDDSNSECEAIAVHFYPEVLRKIYDKELPDFIKAVETMEPVQIRKVQTDQMLKSYIEGLQFYFSNPGMVSDELLKLKVKELILLLAKSDNSRAIQQLISSLFTPKEYSFKEVIESNLYNNLSNEELAILTNMSLSSFKREFDKIYQMSPARYFKSRKLKRAAELLSQTSQRISDIAFTCGFAEISHFSKSFTTEFGVSPSEYRLNQTTK